MYDINGSADSSGTKIAPLTNSVYVAAERLNNGLVFVAFEAFDDHLHAANAVTSRSDVLAIGKSPSCRFVQDESSNWSVSPA